MQQPRDEGFPCTYPDFIERGMEEHKERMAAIRRRVNPPRLSPLPSIPVSEEKMNRIMQWWLKSEIPDGEL